MESAPNMANNFCIASNCPILGETYKSSTTESTTVNTGTVRTAFSEATTATAVPTKSTIPDNKESLSPLCKNEINFANELVEESKTSEKGTSRSCMRDNNREMKYNVNMKFIRLIDSAVAVSYTHLTLPTILRV